MVEEEKMRNEHQRENPSGCADDGGTAMALNLINVCVFEPSPLSPILPARRLGAAGG